MEVVHSANGGGVLGYTCRAVVPQLLPPQRRACITARSAAHHLSAHDAIMSASTLSSASDGDAESGSDAPHVEALFLIRFDKKVG